MQAEICQASCEVNHNTNFCQEKMVQSSADTDLTLRPKEESLDGKFSRAKKNLFDFSIKHDDH